MGCRTLVYDLGEPLPDYSSLIRIRKRYGEEVLRRFCDAIVEQCHKEKLVWGQDLYIDSTQVNANADLDSLTPREAHEARAAIQTHLAACFLMKRVNRSNKQQRQRSLPCRQKALLQKV